jgi:hypothetical protein
MLKSRTASFAFICVVALTLAAGCTRAEAIEDIPEGTEVMVMTEDGALVRGTLTKVDPEVVTLTGERPSMTTAVTRTAIKEVRRVDPEEEDSAAAAPMRESVAVVRTVTVPDNADIEATLDTSHASDTSRVEDRVTATVASPVVVDGVTAIPSGATLIGHVTHVEDSGKVKGRAELGLRFTRLQSGSVTYDIDTRPLAWVAESTKKDDAIKIGIGAAAGAVIGAITGGKKGAAIGTAVGAGGGTAVVLATEGDEIRLASGRSLKISLTNPLTIRTR